MWRPEHRHAADRSSPCYPSDLSDAERAILEPLIPPAKRGGRKMRGVEGDFPICQWKAPPEEHGARSQVMELGRDVGAH